MKAERLRQIHLSLAGFWAVLVIPTILWWKDSVPFLVFVSIYTVIVDHLGAWQASRAEEAADK